MYDGRTKLAPEFLCCGEALSFRVDILMMMSSLKGN